MALHPRSRSYSRIADANRTHTQDKQNAKAQKASSSSPPHASLVSCQGQALFIFGTLLLLFAVTCAVTVLLSRWQPASLVVQDSAATPAFPFPLHTLALKGMASLGAPRIPPTSSLGSMILPHCPRHLGVPRAEDPLGAAYPTVLFGILTAKALEDRRMLLRASWIPLLDQWSCAAHVFVQGEPNAKNAASVDGDVLTLRVRDDYENLPHKVLAFFSLARHAGLDFVVKLDDRCVQYGPS